MIYHKDFKNVNFVKIGLCPSKYVQSFTWLILNLCNSRQKTCPLTTAIQYHENEIARKRCGEDIHMFMLDEKNVYDSIVNFNRLYSQRTGLTKDYWLLESTYWTNKFQGEELVKEILADFKDTPMDLDDDLYFFSGTKHIWLQQHQTKAYKSCNFCKEISRGNIVMYEMYEIHPSLPRKFKYVGSWNVETKFNIAENQKWMRRRDMEVI